MPGPEQIETLHTLHALFRENSNSLVIFTLVTMGVGAILLGLVAWDWNRRRWESLLPILLGVTGVAVLASSFVLYSAFGTLAALEYDVPLTIWRETPYAAEINAVKLMAAQTSAWAVLGLTTGFLYLMLAGAALVKNWFLRRRQRRGSEHTTPVEYAAF